MDSSYYFKCLEKSEIDECAKFVSKIFANFDPFISILEISEFELYKNAKSDLENIVDDQLVVICKRISDKKIIGSYAGTKFATIDKLLSNFHQNTSLNYKIKTNEMTIEDKCNLLLEIDYTILQNTYKMRLENNELSSSIFCDYYCIANEYFKTNLGKELALIYFSHCNNKGIKHIYGTFFNIKAINMFKKYFAAEIVQKLNINFDKSEEKKFNFEILLLHILIAKQDLSAAFIKNSKL